MFMVLLPTYDVEWADEKNRMGRIERPLTLELEGQFLPNMEERIRIRAKASA